MNLFKEKCKAQRIIEDHFRQKEKEDREGQCKYKLRSILRYLFSCSNF
jgi:hypothetical protein